MIALNLTQERFGLWGFGVGRDVWQMRELKIMFAALTKHSPIICSILARSSFAALIIDGFATNRSIRGQNRISNLRAQGITYVIYSYAVYVLSFTNNEGCPLSQQTSALGTIGFCRRAPHLTQWLSNSSHEHCISLPSSTAKFCQDIPIRLTLPMKLTCTFRSSTAGSPFLLRFAKNRSNDLKLDISSPYSNYRLSRIIPAVLTTAAFIRSSRHNKSWHSNDTGIASTLQTFWMFIFRQPVWNLTAYSPSTRAAELNLQAQSRLDRRLEQKHQTIWTSQRRNSLPCLKKG